MYIQFPTVRSNWFPSDNEVAIEDDCVFNNKITHINPPQFKTVLIQDNVQHFTLIKDWLHSRSSKSCIRNVMLLKSYCYSETARIYLQGCPYLSFIT